MGGVGKFLFGSKGKPQESESGNHAWNEIEHYFQPMLGYGTQGGDAIANLLGVGAPRVGDKAGQYSYEGGGATGGSGGAAGGQQGALSNWANSGGMQFLMDTMQKGVTSSKAAQGLLKSGSYGTALQDRAMGLGSTYLNQYMDNLFKFSNLGLGAGGLMASAGQYSKGQGATPGKQGAAPMILQAASMIPGISDERLKENVEFIERRADGLGLYSWNYKQDAPINLPKGRFVGVMAQEVAELRPELLGEPVNGYLTVKAPLFPERIG